MWVFKNMTITAAKALEILANLNTPEKCEIFEGNALKQGRPDLAVAARKRALELRAVGYGARTDAERQCLEAIYAYERILTEKNNKKTHATRTWPMVKRYGILGAVERAVNRKAETAGYTALVEMGLEDYAFEAVVVRYPTLFSPEAVAHSKARINARNQK
jgi:hypothetical protein